MGFGGIRVSRQDIHTNITLYANFIILSVDVKHFLHQTRVKKRKHIITETEMVGQNRKIIIWKLTKWKRDPDLSNIFFKPINSGLTDNAEKVMRLFRIFSFIFIHSSHMISRHSAILLDLVWIIISVGKFCENL